MPATQFLQGSPGFGEQLGANLGQGFSQGLGVKLAQLHEQKANARKLQGLAPILEQLGIPKESMEQLIQSGLSPEAIAPFAKLLGEGGVKKTSAPIQGVFDTMSTLIKENAPGIGIAPLTKIGANREGVQNRAKYKSMRGKIESILLPLQSKGALTGPRFEFILSQIPKGDESQREQVGKLQGLAESLSEEGLPIDTSILDSIEWAKSKSDKKTKPSSGSSEEFVLMNTPKGPKRIPKSKVISAQQAGATLIQ